MLLYDNVCMCVCNAHPALLHHVKSLELLACTATAQLHLMQNDRTLGKMASGRGSGFPGSRNQMKRIGMVASSLRRHTCQWRVSVFRSVAILEMIYRTAIGPVHKTHVCVTRTEGIVRYGMISDLLAVFAWNRVAGFVIA